MFPGLPGKENEGKILARIMAEEGEIANIVLRAPIY